MTRMFAVLWVISCAYASLAFAQSSGKSYLSQRLVHLSVVASDAKGDPVVDLRAADVQVREDGQLCNSAPIRCGPCFPPNSIDAALPITCTDRRRTSFA